MSERLVEEAVVMGAMGAMDALIRDVIGYIREALKRNDMDEVQRQIDILEKSSTAITDYFQRAKLYK